MSTAVSRSSNAVLSVSLVLAWSSLVVAALWLATASTLSLAAAASDGNIVLAVSFPQPIFVSGIAIVVISLLMAPIYLGSLLNRKSWYLGAVILAVLCSLATIFMLVLAVYLVILSQPSGVSGAQGVLHWLIYAATAVPGGLTLLMLLSIIRFRRRPRKSRAVMSSASALGGFGLTLFVMYQLATFL